MAKVFIFCFFFHGSRQSETLSELYMAIRKVERGTKNCLDMAFYLFQFFKFLRGSTIRVPRYTLRSFLLAYLTQMLLEEECQLL